MKNLVGPSRYKKFSVSFLGVVQREFLLIRHEHFVSDQLGLKSSMHMLHIGCGVGGPMAEIARKTGWK